MEPGQDLQLALLVHAQDVVLWPQRDALPATLIQFQYDTGLPQELGIPGEKPTVIDPGAQSVLLI